MDIALDMVEHGLREVTLVQRGRTLVLKGEWAFGAMSRLLLSFFPQASLHLPFSSSLF